MFGIIGKAVKHFGSFAKNVFGKFGHLFTGQKKEETQPDYPNVPTLGYQKDDPNAPWNKNKSMIDKAKEKYGGHSGYHRDSRLVNI